LGVPHALLGLHRSAELTMHDALDRVLRADIPIVMSIGNDGPGDGTANPWALTPGVILATATDEHGQKLWVNSSRLRAEDVGIYDLFAAHGYLTVGPLGAGGVKTPAMLEAERLVDLTAKVGKGNEKYFRIDSGTSYAAPMIVNGICIAHQAIVTLRVRQSALEPLSGHLPQFVTAFIDNGLDRTHPRFKYRLADEREKFSGSAYKFTVEQRMQIGRQGLAGSELDLTFRRSVVSALLRQAARPVPETRPQDVGFGFVSGQLVAAKLLQLTAVDLVTLFADQQDPRIGQWEHMVADDKKPFFTTEDTEQFLAYCADDSLVMPYDITPPKNQ